MAKFVLEKSRIIEDRIVPLRIPEKLELGWEELKGVLVPSSKSEEIKMLGFMGPSAFIGRMLDNYGADKLFYIRNSDLSNNIDWIIRADPEFASRVKSIYLVESVSWDAKLEESNSVGRT